MSIPKKYLTTFNGIHSAKNFLHKITEEFSLCLKLNGLSEAKSNCSNYTEGDCNGACINKENTVSYNDRVKSALNKYCLSDKECIIVDSGREIGEYSALLIRNGVFKGYGFYDLNHQINNIHILESIITPMNGGENTKHLIETYLRKRRVKKIIPLTAEN